MADNRDIKVSVLVPIYGVEKFIEHCVRSLFEQTMTDGIEFIFTDDCSPDHSVERLEEILKDYPKRKNQVKILRHDINKGLAAARVTGLREAQGEYVIHCDSDDWVEPEMYEQLYLKAKETNADIVGCNVIKELGDSSIVKSENFSKSAKEIVISILSGSKDIDAYLWCRLIRKDLYLSNNITAPEDASMLEDMAVTIPLHFLTDRVYKVEKPLYHYRLRENSLTHISQKYVDSSLLVLSHLQKFCSDDPDIMKAYQHAVARFAQPLITQKELLDATRWRNITNNIPIKYFGSFRHRISPWLVRNKLDILNSYLIKFYRLLYNPFKY